MRVRALWRQGRVFGLILAGTFGLTAWPMAVYGFDWVANGNDDMAFYCLAATGYRDHGFATVPTLDDMMTGRDGTQALWFFYVLYQVRPSEMSVAMGSAYAGLSAQQVFMPVIVALNLALVASGSGLAGLGAGRRAAIVTGAMLGVSAPTTYGVVQQVLGQVGGLALVCAALALVSGRFRRIPTGVLLRRAGACGVVFAALLISYPEVIPILVGGCIILGVRELLRGRLDRRHLVHAALAILVMLVLLPVYIYGATAFLRVQSGATGASDTIKELFPYFLTPRGPAILFGLLPISGQESNWFQNMCIVIGFLLLASLVLPSLRDLRRSRAFAAAFAMTAGLTAMLYVREAAFGLFKIAMFIQPFLWAVVGAWVARRRGWTLRVTVPLLIALAALNIRTQFWYVDQSRGENYRVEVPTISTRHSLAQFRELLKKRTAEGNVDRVLLATENVVLVKLLASEVRDVPVNEFGVSPLRVISTGGLSAAPRAPWLKFHEEWKAPLLAMGADLAAYRERNRTTVRDPDTGQPLHKLLYPVPDLKQGPPERTLVAAGVGGLSVLNRHQYPETGPALLCTPLADLHNFAVFCDASGARQQYLSLDKPEETALYRLEVDFAFAKRTFAGAGRAMLLEVLNPSPRVRVLVNHTGTTKALPTSRTVAPVQVIGDRRVALGAIGSGAARLVSPPLALQTVGSGQFLAIDFGPAMPLRPNDLASIERLWGAELPRDPRRLTGHLREVSVLSEQEYAAFRPPQAIAQFPSDLDHPHIEYSGFFETGWMGKEAKVRLSQTDANQECVVRGGVPGIPGAPGFRTELTVLLDGAPVERKILAPGDFEVRVPGPGPGAHWIELRFSQTQVVPAPDGRELSAITRFIGFEPKNEALSRPPQQLSAFPADLAHPKLQQSGIHLDGWLDSTTRALLTQAAPGGSVVVRGQVPEIGGNGGYRTELTVLVDGVEVARRELGPGDFEVRAPAGKTAQARWVECRFSNTQVLPPPDNRRVGAHVRFIGFEAP
jgi:hypothetical protein